MKTLPSIPIYDLEGNVKKTVELPKQIFSVVDSPRLLAQYIRVYLANQRQGTASTKTRGEVVGSTRKIYRQKGTGKARHGDIRAPIFVGGGIVGGPKPKDYSLKINKKQKRKALFNSLTIKFKEKAVMGLVNEFLKIEPKTKIIANFLKKIKVDDRAKVLLVLPKLEKNNLVLASRNLPIIKIAQAESINPYLILNSKVILFVEDALPILEKHFLKKQKK